MQFLFDEQMFTFYLYLFAHWFLKEWLGFTNSDLVLYVLSIFASSKSSGDFIIL